ncbi:MAG: hypothetical protein LBP81_01685 [Treponema sp.]|nr:hypothetical protein [Treponema sp.]
MSRFFNEMAIGGEAERHDGCDPREEQRKRREAGDTGPDSFAGSRIEDMVITTQTALLRGYVYWPDFSPESPPDFGAFARQRPGGDLLFRFRGVQRFYGRNGGSGLQQDGRPHGRRGLPGLWGQ